MPVHCTSWRSQGKVHMSCTPTTRVGCAAAPTADLLLPAPENDESTGSEESGWYPVETALRKRLAFDHAEILTGAVERLRAKVEYTSLPAFLLQEPFTLPHIRSTYDIVLDRPKGWIRMPLA